MPGTRRATQADLFTKKSQLPQGFAYREDILSKKEESDTVRHIESLPFKPFEFHGYLGNRRIVSFGWRYDYAGRTLRESAQMPDFLAILRESAADFAHVPAESLQQVLVTEYAPGAGIGWHRDKPMFEDVMAFSFLSSCRLRFRRRREQDWERTAVTIEPRSIYLLRGPARRDWYHSIPALPVLRYSVTFRNFVETK